MLANNRQQNCYLRPFCIGLAILLGVPVLVENTSALPPLGLTFIDSLSEPLPFSGSGTELAVIDGSAYVSLRTGVWQTNSVGNSTFHDISHSSLGLSSSLFGLTQVVKAADNELYVAGTFEDLNSNKVGALFELSSPNTELVTWQSASSVVGVDRNLRTLGYDRYLDASVAFHIDGSVVPLGVPPGCQPGECVSAQSVSQVTEGGYAIGEMLIPGSIGSGPGIWAPDGSAMVVGSGIGGGGIADRLDGGINYATRADEADYRFRLGDLDVRLTHDSNGNQLRDGYIGVTQSDFTFIYSSVAPQMFVYYPGIVPGSPNSVLPLTDVIPELASISFDAITDSYVIGNRIYMTLYDDGDLYLFGAWDPSQVPEPSALALVAITLAFSLIRRRIA